MEDISSPTPPSSSSSAGAVDIHHDVLVNRGETPVLDSSSQVKLLESKLIQYFENSFKTELNPLSNAMEFAAVATSIKRAFLMYPILSYVQSRKQADTESAKLIEMKQLLQRINQMQRNHLLELEEYNRVIITPSNREEELSEFRKEYNAADDQINSQMKASDERRLDTAIQTMNSLETDEVKGGYARLLSLIEIGAKCTEDAVETLKSRLSASREEFISLRHSDVLLEKTAQISYERIRDAYAHLLRLSHKRANANDLQWIELETKGRESMISEMKSMLTGYRSSSSSLSASSENEQAIRINEHRLTASRRLQRFGDKVISSSLKRTETREKYAEASLRSKRIAAFAWRKRQSELMNDWLWQSQKEIGSCYVHSIEQLHDNICQIRSQIQCLDLHAKKLTHLKRISVANYETIRNKSVQKRRGSFRSSVNGKAKDVRRDGPDESPIPPSVSMNIGSRVWGLCRAVGVDSEESVVLLTQLLHTAHPDPLMLQRISHFINHYDSILAKRK